MIHKTAMTARAKFKHFTNAKWVALALSTYVYSGGNLALASTTTLRNCNLWPESIWAMSREVREGLKRLYRVLGWCSVSVFSPLLEIIQIFGDLQALELAEKACFLSNKTEVYRRAIYCPTLLCPIPNIFHFTILLITWHDVAGISFIPNNMQ